MGGASKPAALTPSQGKKNNKNYAAPPSTPTQDLYDAIARGEYPEWHLFVQTMRPEDQDKFE